MMQRPSKIQAFLIVLGGMLGAYVWVRFFTLWAIYDTPLLRLAAGSEGGFFLVSLFSLCLFSFLTAALFIAVLYAFYRHCFKVAAIIFGLAFFLSFAVSALIGGDTTSLISLSPLWWFIAFFIVCAFVLGKFTMPNNSLKRTAAGQLR